MRVRCSKCGGFASDSDHVMCPAHKNGLGRTDGRKRHPNYGPWIEMRRRCNDQRRSAYRLYGGRGIRVCERWDDFWAFVEDMGVRPAGFCIDRVDPDGNYEPGNCRWVSRAESNRNRRDYSEWSPRDRDTSGRFA